MAGHTRDALVDMTGGVGENLKIKDFKTEAEQMKLFKILKSSYKDKSLMSASMSAVSSFFFMDLTKEYFERWRKICVLNFQL